MYTPRYTPRLTGEARPLVTLGEKALYVGAMNRNDHEEGKKLPCLYVKSKSSQASVLVLLLHVPAAGVVARGMGEEIGANSDAQKLASSLREQPKKACWFKDVCAVV